MAGGYAVPFVHVNGTSMGYVGSDTFGTVVTSGGSANAKGSWTVLASSTPADFTHLYLMLNGIGSAANNPVAFDLAAAPSGSEASGLIAQNVVYDLRTSIQCHALVPCGFVAAGSRLAVRMASGTASDTIDFGVTGFDGGWLSQTSNAGVDTYGYGGSGAIKGLTVDPGATAGAKGAYTQVTASAPNDYCGLFLGFDNLQNFAPAANNATCLVDVALGAAASEKVIVPNIAVPRNFFSEYQLAPALTPTFYVPVKAGTRIAVRASCAISTATDRLLGVSLYGVRR